MAVELLIGGLGVGKSTAILDAIAAENERAPEGPPLILLVPEQASYLAEKRLLARLGTGATQRARVLSFHRLAEWVWSMGPARSRPPLEEVHQFVLVTTLLARRRRRAMPDDPWRVPSLARGVAQLLAEMKQFRVGPKRLAQWADAVAATDADLAARLRLLEDIVAEMDRLVGERFEDPHDSLASVREAVQRLDGLQGSRVWIDGFHGFTPVEFEVLRGVVRRFATVTIALTLDPARARHVADKGWDPGQFSRSLPTEETYARVRGLVLEERIELRDDVVLGGPARRFVDAPPLAFLARHFLAETPGKVEFAGGASPHLALEVAATPRDEARRAVEHLVRWHGEHGVAWGRMAIVARDLAPYVEPLAEALALLGVPHYIDRHEPVETHPLIQGCLAAVDVAIGGWRTEAVMAFARAGLHGATTDDVARLGAFVVRYPRKPADWLAREPWPVPAPRSPFEVGEDDDERAAVARLDPIREAVVAPLLKAVEAARAGVDDEGRWRVTPLAAALGRLVHGAYPAPPDEATEALLKEFGKRLDALVVAAGEEPMEPDVLRDVVRETLGRLAVPGIPPVLDVATVAEADRSRLPQVDAVVVLGLADGRFPALGRNRTLLSDRERETLLKLDGHGLRLSTRHQYLREGYLAHLALGQARRFLVLLRPASTTSGEALAKSPWWTEVERLMPSVKEVTLEPLLSPSRVARPAEVATIAARSCFGSGERRPWLDTSLSSLMLASGASEATRTEVTAVLRRALDRNEPRVSPTVLRAFLGERWNTSVSSLEAWPACPFRFFLRAVVRPDVSTRPELEAADAGNFAHAVLQQFSQRLLAGELTFADVATADDTACREWIDDAAAGPRRRLGEAGLMADERGRVVADRLQQELARVIAHWAAVAVRTRMRLRASETRFGGRDGDLRGIDVDLDTGADKPLRVHLRGQIDRIDLFDTKDGTTWIGVGDYKLSARDLKWADVVDGSALQLAAYLAVVADNAETLGVESDRLAGAYYMPITVGADKERQWRGVLNAEAWEALGLDAPKGGARFGTGTKGALLATGNTGDAIAPRQMAALPRAVRRLIERAVRGFLSGAIEVRPRVAGRHSACTHCDYKPACRLDHALNATRTVAAMRRAEAIERLLGTPTDETPVSPTGDTS